MRCEICDINYEVGKCIVCGKWVCYEKHADTLWFNLGVSSDCGHYIENDNLSFEYCCCLEGNSREEIQKALQKEFRKIPNHMKYIKIAKIE
ncbi:hypothetical protein LCGC14_1245220 [marine sediment metagenome]|uniref:Uncharacterized protein n=1 Tax=marine sediment metagenome TaxID=412755 RepID=A0A0F9NM16_9ZZZZ